MDKNYDKSKVTFFEKDFFYGNVVIDKDNNDNDEDINGINKINSNNYTDIKNDKN